MDLIDNNIDNAISTDSAKIGDDALKENADFAEKAGLEVRVTRVYDGVGLSNKRQCQWCLERCGRNMTLTEAYEKGAFQRHPGCGCEVEITTKKSETSYQSRRGGSQKKNPEEIVRKIDFYAGEGNKVLPAELKEWIGDNQYRRLIDNASGEESKKYIRTAYRKSAIIGDGGTADVRKFEIATGRLLGRNGRSHAQKIKELINLIDKSLRNNISESERQYLQDERMKLSSLMDWENNK